MRPGPTITASARSLRRHERGRVGLSDGAEGAADVAVMCVVHDHLGAARHLGVRLASLLLRQFGPPTVDDGKTERAGPLRRRRELRYLDAARPVRCRDWGLSPPSMY